MKGQRGKGWTIILCCFLYIILRYIDIIDKPMFILDIFMSLSFVYSVFLIIFKK